MTWTQLHDACVHQDTSHVIELAHAHSEQAWKADDHGLTPLHILVWGNPSAEAVKALLEASPQAVSDSDVHGDTPLHLACSNPNADKHLIQMLLDACPTAASMKNHEGLMPLHMACRYTRNEAVIGLLIENYPYAQRTQIKLGSPAPQKESTSKEHFDHLFDPAPGMSAKTTIDYRFEAMDHKQIRDGAYPLHMAVAAGAPLSVIEILIKEADDILLKPNKYGETPVHIALLLHSADEVIETLIRYGPKALHMRDQENGNLPIHNAAVFGCSVHVAKALLEKWPELVLERNAANLTPIELALQSEKCSEDVLRLLEITAESII